MKTLQEIYSNYSEGTDKGTTHSYIEVYEKLLEKYRHGCSIMELGLAVGDYLYMWQEYFLNSKIIGVDTNDGFPKSKFPGIEIITADCTKPEFLQYVNGNKFDIIIDDASHRTEDQIASFNLFKSYMNKGGIYIIEDLQDIDNDERKYLSLSENVEILDRRKIKGRYDDVLCIINF